MTPTNEQIEKLCVDFKNREGKSPKYVLMGRDAYANYTKTFLPSNYVIPDHVNANLTIHTLVGEIPIFNTNSQDIYMVEVVG